MKTALVLICSGVFTALASLVSLVWAKVAFNASSPPEIVGWGIATGLTCLVAGLAILLLVVVRDMFE